MSQTLAQDDSIVTPGEKGASARAPVLASYTLDLKAVIQVCTMESCLQTSA